MHSSTASVCPTTKLSERWASPQTCSDTRRRTGTVLLRWDGARDAVVWCVPPHDIAPRDARLELARRYLHIYGPSTVESVARWAGIGKTEAEWEAIEAEAVALPLPSLNGRITIHRS